MPAPEILETEAEVRTAAFLKQLVERVKSDRERLKLTKVQLAYQTDLSVSFLCKLEGEKVSNCELRTMIKLGIILGWKIEIVFPDP